MGKKAIIIGAGPAGLTAAYYLLKNTDIQPIVLEQDDVVGGISRTVNFAGNRMDIGGHRFFSKSGEVTSLWAELLPLQGRPALDDKMLNRKCQLADGGADPEKVNEVFLLRHRISRILYLRKLFSYPVSLGIDTVRNLGFRRMLGICFSYLGAMLRKRPEKNLEDFMINRFGTRLYETFFEKYTEKVWGRHPKDIGAEWGAQRIKGVSLKKVLTDFFQRALRMKSKETEASLIESFQYPKYGPGQLWEKMRDEVLRLGGEIYMSSKVVRLLSDSSCERLTGVVFEKDGEIQELSAEYIISSMPIAELVDAIPNDMLDKDVKDIGRNLPYRDFMTAGLLVDRLELKNRTKHPTLGNIVPDCWIYVQEPDVKLGRIQIFNNWSPYLVEDPLKKVWLGLEYFCQKGDDLWQMKNEDFLAFAEDELKKIGVIRDGCVEKGCVVRMEKAYPAYFGTYKDFPKLQKALDEIPNLYCVGRNGQHRYNNMDHSMLTAMAAVQAISSDSADKTSVWGVNTETDYHEVK
ncbi:NAD(P)/FAD-dependent oxidoreductase [Anaerovibrio sp.]|uniref:NAD(P)/FAD-dependent oxidoreductase n=1 Tax=Anaerovibrio sp. TaxID=1872532 RepID=UPI003F18DA9C